MLTQVEKDILSAINPSDPRLTEEDEYLEDDYPDEDEEEEEDDTPIVLIVHPKPAPVPAPAPAPAPAPKSDRFSALAEAIVSVKAVIPAAALVSVIQSILDGTDQPFAEDAAIRLAAETPTSTLLEELLAIEALLDKAIEGYPALIAFMTPKRRALLFGKK